MRRGDKVRIVKLERRDEATTTLKIGDIGIVDNIDGEIYCIKFEGVTFKEKCMDFNARTNTYAMHNYQVELVEYESREINNAIVALKEYCRSQKCDECIIKSKIGCAIDYVAICKSPSLWSEYS